MAHRGSGRPGGIHGSWMRLGLTWSLAGASVFARLFRVLGPHPRNGPWDLAVVSDWRRCGGPKGSVLRLRDVFAAFGGHHRVVTLALKILPIIFVSGACSLVYQTVWMRSFRLIFGASTMACAAVVAIFMGGLGLGSYVLGKKVDKHAAPLKCYAQYELMVAAAAAASPLLIWCAEKIYYATGGSAVLGILPSYGVRLLLATLVMGVPTFFMGGTLVAAVASVQQGSDKARSSLGRLYGANTAGAVFGCLLTTFFTIEIFGVSRSLWMACLSNLLLALYAFKLHREDAEQVQSVPVGAAPTEVSAETWPDMEVAAAPARGASLGRARVAFLFFCSAWVGFAFFAMEMVWYRIFAPLLGGSSYSFGIVLAVALFGIAVGGWLFGRRRGGPSTLVLFSLTCALEALWMVLPFAAGDHMATVTLALRPFGIFGFWGMVGSWAVVAGLVVFVPAVLAGYQFPVLVSLLGEGRQGIGQDVGRIYGFNTLGAIAGAVGSGFGLMTWMGANALWVGLAGSMVALSIVALILGRSDGGAPKGFRAQASLVLTVSLLALICCNSEGPSAAMRHSPIGAGRFHDPMRRWVDLENRYRMTRRNNVWEADGREVTVGIGGGNGLSFMVNGKVDGNVRGDAGTQVMCPLIGAMIHGAPKRGLVIGLGTGMSAGWLSQVQTMEKVDVVELEPAIKHMAKLSAAANFDVLGQENVEIHITDGREFLQTTQHHYDVIMSEPSNPYRVGIASLFSQDFYRSVAAKLSGEGVFVQWLQIYEVDAQTVRTVIATVRSVFPSVEIWQTLAGDLALVARKKEQPHKVEELKQIAAQEPYASALRRVWGVQGVEGFFSALIASSKLATEIEASEQDWIDTDDMPLVEFGFSRTVGKGSSVKLPALRLAAKKNGATRPALVGTLDWDAVSDARNVRAHFMNLKKLPLSGKDPHASLRRQARELLGKNQPKECLATWRKQPGAARHPGDQLMLARAAAAAKDPEFETLLAPVEAFSSVDGHLLRGIYRHELSDPSQTALSFVKGFQAARKDIWFSRKNLRVAMNLVPNLIASLDDETLQRRLYDSMAKPFAGYVLETLRRRLLLAVAGAWNFKETCVEALAPFEGADRVPLEQALLRTRARCYSQAQDTRQELATKDLVEFLGEHHAPFFAGAAGE